MTISYASQNAETIKKLAPNFTPKFGLILGSGLGMLADEIERVAEISYRDLQNFGDVGVQGHKGVLVLGTLKGVPVACMQGRGHYYEGNDNTRMQTPIYTLKSIGCENLLLTNAAASLRPEVPPGKLMMISDHINLQFDNPLRGTNNDAYGPRFPGMGDAYDPGLRAQLLAAAKELGIQLPEGVYLAALGPSYETPAEIRAFKLWGADLVGMSTVPEVIVARHCGLKVAAISSVTNMGCGISDEKLTHEGVLVMAKEAAVDLGRILSRFMENVGAIA